MEQRQRITARSIPRAAHDPDEQIALPGFQRGPGQPDVPVGPAQGDQEPTEEQLQGARILDIIRAAPT
eukprot:13322023-Alexandrium_andersonii.AAC.1